MMNKILCTAALALALMGTIAADGPWPPACFPGCKLVATTPAPAPVVAFDDPTPLCWPCK